MVAGKFLFPPWRNKGKGGVTYALAGQLCSLVPGGREAGVYLSAGIMHRHPVSREKAARLLRRQGCLRRLGPGWPCREQWCPMLLPV